MKKRFYALLAALAVLLGGCAPVDLSDQQQVDITGQLQESAPSATEAEESAAPSKARCAWPTTPRIPSTPIR